MTSQSDDSTPLDSVKIEEIFTEEFAQRSVVIFQPYNEPDQAEYEKTLVNLLTRIRALQPNIDIIVAAVERNNPSVYTQSRITAHILTSSVALVIQKDGIVISKCRGCINWAGNLLIY